MADRIKGITIEIDGETTGLKQALSGITSQSISIQKELTDVNRLLKFDPGNASALAQKQELLSKQIENTSQKLKALKDAQSQVDAQFASGKIGEEQYRSFQREIQFTEASLNKFKTAYKESTNVQINTSGLSKMQNDLKLVDAELAKTVQEEKKLGAAEGLNKLGSGIEGAKSKLSGLKTAFIGVTATIAGGAGLFAFSEKAIEAGDNAYKLSQKLHLTTAESAQLNKIFTVTGTDSSAFASTMTRLDKSILGAGESGNSTTKMLEKYGVSLTDASGKILPMNDQLEALATAYKKSADAGEEDAFSAEVLGNKGASLIPLLEGYTEAKENASKVKGAFAIDPEEAHKTEEELKVLKLQVGATAGVLAKAFIPFVQEALPPVIEAFQKLASVIGSHKTEIVAAIQSIIDIAKGIGSAIQPIVEGLFNFITEHGEATKNIILVLAGSFVEFELATKAINGVKFAMDAWNNFKGITSAITGMLAKLGLWTAATEAQTIATEAETVAQEGLNVAQKANIIGLIIIAITTLVAAIVYLWNTNEGFRNAIIGAWDAIGAAFSAVWDGIVNFFTVTLPQAFQTVIDFVTNNWAQLLLFLVNPFAGAFALLYNNFDGFRTFVDGFIQDILTFFQTGWNNIVTFFTQSVPAWLASMGAWFSQLPTSIAFGLGEALGSVIKWGIDTYNYLTTNVPIWISSIGQWFSALPGNIWTWLVNTITNIQTWGSNMLTQATTAATNTYNAVVNWFTQLPSGIQTWLTNCITNVTAWGSNMLTEASTGMTNVFNGIIDTFTNLPSKMMEIGGHIVDGLKNGIKDAWNGMTGWIGGLCDSFINGVNKKMEVHSPSRVMYRIGGFVGEGFGLGIESTIGQISKQANAIAEASIPNVNAGSYNMGVNYSPIGSGSNSVSTGSNLDAILSKMDSLEKALSNMKILMDSKEVGKLVTPSISDNLAINNGRRGY